MGKNDSLLIAGAVLVGSYLIAQNAKLNIGFKPSFDLGFDDASNDITSTSNKVASDARSFIDEFLGSPGRLTFDELTQARTSYPITSYLPQETFYNGRFSSTPALIGPLSSKNPSDWQSWLV